STPPGRFGLWSAFSKMRAWVSLRADSVPAAIRCLRYSLSESVRVTVYLLCIIGRIHCHCAIGQITCPRALGLASTSHVSAISTGYSENLPPVVISHRGVNQVCLGCEPDDGRGSGQITGR